MREDDNIRSNEPISNEDVDPETVDIPSYEVFITSSVTFVEQKEDGESKWYKDESVGGHEQKWITWEEGKISMFINRKKDINGKMEYYFNDIYYDTEENARNAAYVFKKYGKIRKKGKK